ncbi:MAG: hypothetical protein K2X69_00360 [Silvanigrellaceae bacterium]|nr:hypothetical protein [Silvanigrellaceae bacterium]
MNSSLFKSNIVRKFEEFCYELFTEEKLLNAHFEIYMSKINSISVKENEKINQKKQDYENDFKDIIKKKLV